MASEKQQKKIWDAAKKCFRETGLVKMTMEDVARESDIPVNTLKELYKNKSELISELMTHGIDHVSTLLAKSLNARGKVDVKLSRFVKALLSDYEIHAPLFKLVCMNFETFDKECQMLHKIIAPEQISRYRQNTVIIARLIAEGQSEGIFRKANPLECAYFLRGCIHGIIRYWTATRYEGKLEDYADKVMRMFFTGIYK
jgi:AcrR family transcriptional regulator